MEIFPIAELEARSTASSVRGSWPSWEEERQNKLFHMQFVNSERLGMTVAQASPKESS